MIDRLTVRAHRIFDSLGGYGALQPLQEAGEIRDAMLELAPARHRPQFERHLRKLTKLLEELAARSYEGSGTRTTCLQEARGVLDRLEAAARRAR